MARMVKFEWGGVSYEIPLLLARKAPMVLEMGEKMANATKSSEQFALALEIAEALGCPKAALDDLPAAEMVPFVVALQDAQMPSPKDDKKVPFGDGGESPSPESQPDPPGN